VTGSSRPRLAQLLLRDNAPENFELGAASADYAKGQLMSCPMSKAMQFEDPVRFSKPPLAAFNLRTRANLGSHLCGNTQIAFSVILGICFFCSGIRLASTSEPPQTSRPMNRFEPRIAPASNEGQRAMEQVRIPSGLKIEL